MNKERDVKDDITWKKKLQNIMFNVYIHMKPGTIMVIFVL